MVFANYDNEGKRFSTIVHIFSNKFCKSSVNVIAAIVGIITILLRTIDELQIKAEHIVHIFYLWTVLGEIKQWKSFCYFKLDDSTWRWKSLEAVRVREISRHITMEAAPDKTRSTCTLRASLNCSEFLLEYDTSQHNGPNGQTDSTFIYLHI